MAITRDQFIGFLEKQAQEATALEQNENDTLSGMQAPPAENVPELLQPEDGPGKGARGETETFSSGAEDRHLEGREGGYLQNALAEFNPAAKETGQQLKGLLTNFTDKSTGTSKAVADAGKDKVSSVQAGAFLDELDKISGIVGMMAKGLGSKAVKGGLVGKQGMRALAKPATGFVGQKGVRAVGGSMPSAGFRAGQATGRVARAVVSPFKRLMGRFGR